MVAPIQAFNENFKTCPTYVIFQTICNVVRDKPGVVREIHFMASMAKNSDPEPCTIIIPAEKTLPNPNIRVYNKKNAQFAFQQTVYRTISGAGVPLVGV